MNVLALCAGIGGIELGLKLAGRVCGFTPRTICMVEREIYAAAVLAKEMEAGNLDACPIWSDIKTFPKVAHLFSGKVDILTGGYPCQPFSEAGQRRGVEDPRHIFPDICRIIEAVQPTLCFFENVSGHLSLGFPEVYQSLRGLGYAVEAGLFTASEVGAPHERERLFILAYRPRDRHSLWKNLGDNKNRTYSKKKVQCWRQGSEFERFSGELGNADQQRSQGRELPRCECTNQLPAWPPGPTDPAWAGILQRWPELAPAVANNDGAGQSRPGLHLSKRQSRETVPNIDGTSKEQGQEAQFAICRVADERTFDLDPAHRVDRLRALGNAVVPSCAAVAFIELWRKMAG